MPSESYAGISPPPPPHRAHQAFNGGGGGKSIYFGVSTVVNEEKINHDRYDTTIKKSLDAISISN